MLKYNFPKVLNFGKVMDLKPITASLSLGFKDKDPMLFDNN
jgi:hypothetical protein